jgi:ribonuclease P protein component
MPRTGRLTSTADFRRTYASGRRASTNSVIAHTLGTGGSRPARIGFSASKGLGGAVRRIRAKRRLREAIRALGRSFEPGVDVVFVATPHTAAVDFQELVDSVHAAARESGAFGA